MEWTQQYEIIRDKITTALATQGRRFSLQNTADLLGVGIGKVRAWERGQRPSADDLETIGRALGFSAQWLLFREGKPYGEADRPIPAASPRPLATTDQTTRPAAGEGLTQQMEALERLLRKANAPDEDIREGLLSLVKAHRPATYPTAEFEQGPGPYGEAAEEPSPYPGKTDKKLAG